MITTDKLAATTGKGRVITLWTLSGLVALAFIGAGGGKLAGTAVMVELFDKVGLGQWFRYFTVFWRWRPASDCLFPAMLSMRPSCLPSSCLARSSRI